MLENHNKIAVFAEGCMGDLDAKMAEGVLRYIENTIVCVVDSNAAGKMVQDVCAIPSTVPIVGTIHEALGLDADTLVLGTAPSGGRVPDSWWDALDEATAGGMSIINGLHDRLAERYSKLPRQDQWIWDIRALSGPAPKIASARAALLSNKRVLMIGTDMAIGKMTAGLELYGWLRQQNVSAAFLATGQTGVTITGRGIPLDAYKVDHAAGAVEELVLAAADKDVLIIEGQGSILHPGSTATLPLMRGSCATHLVLCHKAGKTSVESDETAVPIPPLREFIALNEALATVCGSLTEAKTIGVAVDTRGLDDHSARAALLEIEDEAGLPAQDLVRFGPEKLARLLV